MLEEEVGRHKTLLRERTKQYCREQEIMLSVIHASEMTKVRQHVGSPLQLKPIPTAWLPSLRSSVSIVFDPFRSINQLNVIEKSCSRAVANPELTYLPYFVFILCILFQYPHDAFHS